MTDSHKRSAPALPADHAPPPPATARSLVPFGQTIFTEISLFAAQHNAVNLGQGFPDFDGPEFVKSAAIAAIHAGHAQYARMFGIPSLNAAVARRFQLDSGLQVDPDRHVTITSGCTEAIASALLGLLNPGDHVVVFEPFYDSYRAILALAGAHPAFVTLRPPDFSITRDALQIAFTPSTRAVLINTPHNPTGRVFSLSELELVAEFARRSNALVFSDEVYDKLVFAGPHHSIASLPGMWDRTVTLNSLGKTFSLTGWKIGWAIAPDHLTAAVRAAHQFITFATATPLQHAAVAALNAPDSYYSAFLADYRAKRDRLLHGLQSIGFAIFPPDGTYFILVDHTPFGFSSDVAFCKHLIQHVGVAAIPCSAFFSNPADGRNLVRFAFCKTDQVLDEGLRRMSARLSRSPRSPV